MMIEDMPLIDILASWRYEEQYFSNELQNAYKIDFEPFNPFWSDIPWTAALEKQKVLVVHPFAETIQNNISERKSSTKTQKSYQLLIYKRLRQFRQSGII